MTVRYATGSVVVSGVVLLALAMMVRDLFAGRYAGLSLFWHGLVMVVLFFIVLQGVVDLALPRGSQWLGVSAGPRAIRKAWEQVVDGWITVYRADVEADLAALREPLATLRNALGTPTSDGNRAG